MTAGDGWETYIDLTIPDDVNHIYKDKVINIDPADFGWSDSEFYQVMLGQYNRDNNTQDIWIINNPRVDITPSASLHKVNRNTLRQLKGGAEGTVVTTGSQRDNFFVQHPIPRSDLSYAWVTASISSTAADSLYGYQKNSNDISFDLPQKDFTERTLFNFDPATNTTLLPFRSTGPVSGTYGFSSWESMRRTDYKSTRYIRDNNLFSFWTGKNKTYTNTTVVTQSAVTSKFKPLQHTVNISGDASDTDYTITNTYANKIGKYPQQKGINVGSILNENRGEEGTYYSSIRGYYIDSDQETINSPFSRVKSVKISEVIYPREKSTYSANTRSRTAYEESAGTGDNGYDRQYGKQNTFFHSTKTRSTGTQNSLGFSTDVSGVATTEIYDFGTDLVLPTSLVATNCIGLKADNTSGSIAFVFGQTGETSSPSITNPPTFTEGSRRLEFTFTVSGEVSIDFDFIKGTYDPTGLALEQPDSDEYLYIYYQTPGDTNWYYAKVKGSSGYLDGIITNTHGSNTAYTNIATIMNTIGTFSGIDGAGIDITRNDIEPGVTNGDPFVAGTKLGFVSGKHSGGSYDHYAIRNLKLRYTALPDATEHLAFFPLQTDGLNSFPLSGSYRSKVGELLIDKDDTAYSTSPTPSQCFVETTSLVKDQMLSDYVERTTNQIAGTEPWLDSYDDFREDYRGYAKDMSVLPEFKISDHLEEYYKDFVFEKPPIDYLSLPGGSESKGEILDTDANNTGEEDFIDKFAISEPMRDYKTFLEEHADKDIEIKSVKIRVDAIKKLLPYNGFYPMTRTVQLGNLLSSSFIDHVTGKEGEESGYNTQGFQAISKTLISPGILYNSIKAGYGVSYPIYETTPPTTINNSNRNKNPYDGFHIDSAPDYQIPFEALINPKGNIPEKRDNRKIVFTPSWTSLTPAAPAYDYSGFWDGENSPEFQLGMHNFLAETVKFFIEGGRLKSFTSRTDSPDATFSTAAGKTYSMDVVMRDSEKMDRMGTYSGVKTTVENSYFNPGGNTVDFFSGSDGVYSVVLSRGSQLRSTPNKLSLYKFEYSDGWTNKGDLTFPDDRSSEDFYNLSACSGSDEVYVAIAADNSTRYGWQGFAYVYKYRDGAWQTTTRDILTSSLHTPTSSGRKLYSYGKAIKIIPSADNGYHFVASDTNHGSISYDIKESGGSATTTNTVSIGANRGMLFLHHSSSAEGLRQQNMFHNVSNINADSQNFRNLRLDMVSSSFTTLESDIYPSGSMDGLFIVAGSPRSDSPSTNAGAVCIYYSGSLHGTASMAVVDPSAAASGQFGVRVAAGVNNTSPNRNFYFAASTLKDDIGTVEFFTASVFSSSAETEINLGRTHTFDATYLTSSGFPANQSVEFGTNGGILKAAADANYDYFGSQLSIANSSTTDGQADQVILAIGTEASVYHTRTSPYSATGSICLIDIDGNGYVAGDTTGTTAGRLTFLPMRNHGQAEGYRFAATAGTLKKSGKLKVISGSGNPFSPSEEVLVFSSEQKTSQNYTIDDTPGKDYVVLHTGSLFSVNNQYTSSFDSTGNPVSSPYMSASLNSTTNFVYRKDGALYGQGIGSAYDPAYVAYTPPSYYGTSIARITYTAPDTGGPVSLDDIFNKENTTVEELVDIDPNRVSQFYGRAESLSKLQDRSKMPLSSSVNLFGKFTPVDPVTGIKDASNESWVISTRFESPVLDFSVNDSQHSSSYTAQNSEMLSSFDFSSAPSHLPPRSMWTSYGKIPSTTGGITLEIVENSVGESLADLCGFTPGTKNVGQVSSGKEISEAIVLIPYKKGGAGTLGGSAMRQVFSFSENSSVTSERQENIARFVNNHSFVDLDGQTFATTYNKIKSGEDPNSGVSKMINGMEKYILPPHLDFLRKFKKNNEVLSDGITPFAMYFMEFSHNLSQEDLLNIWQGVAPEIANNFNPATAEISHTLQSGELFKNSKQLQNAIRDDLSFLIFKVKKRAEMNYYNVTKDSNDDPNFSFRFSTDDATAVVPDYSYNWPYDFFSLVETAKVTCELNIASEEEAEEEPDLDDQMQQGAGATIVRR